jgi:hypothetical protein
VRPLLAVNTRTWRNTQAQVLRPWRLMLPAMDSPNNTLDDLPADTFTILAFCDTCGHQAPLDRTRVPAGVTVQALRMRLRCSACGSHATSLRPLYRGWRVSVR